MTAIETDAPRWIEYEFVDEIVPALTNAKRHAADEIAASIGRFGMVEQITKDERTGRVISGHGRLEYLLAAFAEGRSMPEGCVEVDGRWQAPVVRGWTSADDAEAEAAGIALNRVGEVGGWDAADLAESLQRISHGEIGLVGLGYTGDDLIALLADLAPPQFSPGSPEEQPRLDVRNPIICPNCGHHFHRA